MHCVLFPLMKTCALELCRRYFIACKIYSLSSYTKSLTCFCMQGTSCIKVEAGYHG
jgi:hypothetical protein